MANGIFEVGDYVFAETYRPSPDENVMRAGPIMEILPSGEFVVRSVVDGELKDETVSAGDCCSYYDVSFAIDFTGGNHPSFGR